MSDAALRRLQPNGELIRSTPDQDGRRSEATRSRPSRQQRSTGRRGSSASRRCSPMRRASGCPPSGRSARSAKRRRPAALTYARPTPLHPGRDRGEDGLDAPDLDASGVGPQGWRSGRFQRSLCGSDSIWILISSTRLSTPKSVNARVAERLHGDDTTVPKAGLFTHFFKPDAAAGNWQVDFLCGQA